MVICVLLNEAATWTTPCGTTRFSRFFLNSFLRFAGAAALAPAADFAGAVVPSGAVFCSFATFHSISRKAESKKFTDTFRRTIFLQDKAQHTAHHRSSETSPSCPSPVFWLRLLRGAVPYGYARWCACAAREPASCGGAEYRDKPALR